MTLLLQSLVALPIAVPLLGALTLQVIGAKTSERWISRIALSTAAIHSLLFVLLLVVKILGYNAALRLTVFEWADNKFILNLFSDWASLSLLFLVTFLTGTVLRFSQVYMHREEGYSRFFATLLIFQTGMSLIALSAQLDGFFAGWELVGISSFLLIGFYRHRKIPLINALKVFAIYRVCDVGLLVGVIMEHQLQLEVSFQDLPGLSHILQSLNPTALLGVSLLLLLAAAGKSAQLPFTYWLPRAMEGPTPSSAVFYGALSVHAGVFLLYRTHPIWYEAYLSRMVIGGVGLLTAFFATGSGRVQSTVKGQIAYASATQVGIMFVELALGFPTLALIHMIGNSLLRCYQLLVSPSVIVHLLKQQSSAHSTELGKKQALHKSLETMWPKRFRYSLYCLATSEGYFEQILHSAIVIPLQYLAKKFDELTFTLPIIGAIILIAGVSMNLSEIEILQAVLVGWGVVIGLTTLNNSYTFTRVVNRAGFANAIVATGVGVLAWHKMGHLDAAPFIVGTLVFLLLTHAALLLIKGPMQNLALFICVLGIIGFPISPVFFGEDLVIDTAIHQHVLLAFMFIFNLVVTGIALISSYSKNFLQHYQEIR